MFRNVLSRLSTSPWLRRLVLPLLERFNPGDVRIRHHYTQRPFVLHSYRHKGYWFHGRRRERQTMQLFGQIVQPGDVVIEVGGHIGYLTVLFAELVGPTGHVVVFEPGRNNVPYLRHNIDGLQTVELMELAVSNVDGAAPFFEEDLTGQNNSLLADYEQFQQNRQLAFSDCTYHPTEVRTVRLDTFVRERSLRPDLIKIDIEGAEALALEGSVDLLAEHLPMIVVEVTRRAADVFNLLTGLGYQLCTPDGTPLGDAGSLNDNVCAFHPTRHRHRLRNCPWSMKLAAA